MANIPQFSAQPLYMSESEEDYQFALDNNMIDKKEFNRLMQELEFDNAEVELAPEYLGRADLTA